MRIPKLFNIRADPFERGEEGLFYQKWFVDRAFLMVPAQMMVAEYLKTFEQFPPRQRPASFSIDQALEKARQKQAQLGAAASGGTGAGGTAHDGGAQPPAP
jgi:arylsulfatase